MADEPSAEAVRNAALLLLAAEAALCDDREPEEALTMARRLEQAMDEPPWSNGQHEGDCMKQAHTCLRCVWEEALATARRMWDEE